MQNDPTTGRHSAYYDAMRDADEVLEDALKPGARRGGCPPHHACRGCRRARRPSRNVI
jgi:hypothetical protein